jgi:hypothetical protein
MTWSFSASLLVVALLASAQLPAVSAAEANSDIGDPAGPLYHIWVGQTLGCMVQKAPSGTTLMEFYPRLPEPGDCGTFAVVDGVLYAPDFTTHTHSATDVVFPSTNIHGMPYTPFTPIYQTVAVSGGVHVVATQVRLGSSGITLDEVDSYVAGAPFYSTQVSITNDNPIIKGARKQVRIYRAADCMLDGNDQGYGFAAAGIVGCTRSLIPASSNPDTYGEWWVPHTPGGHYTEGDYYSDVWNAVGNQLQFDDQPAPLASHPHEDNGAGLQWDFLVPAGLSIPGISHDTCWGDAGTCLPSP